jgi:hypothetical protein
MKLLIVQFFPPPLTSSHPHPVQIFKVENLNKAVAGHLIGRRPKARNKDKDLRIATWHACLHGGGAAKTEMDGWNRMLCARGWR